MGFSKEFMTRPVTPQKSEKTMTPKSPSARKSYRNVSTPLVALVGGRLIMRPKALCGPPQGRQLHIPCWGRAHNATHRPGRIGDPKPRNMHSGTTTTKMRARHFCSKNRPKPTLSCLGVMTYASTEHAVKIKKRAVKRCWNPAEGMTAQWFKSQKRRAVKTLQIVTSTWKNR
jgi:hypothetical protein